MKRTFLKRKTPMVRAGWTQGRSARIRAKSEKRSGYQAELAAVTPEILARAGHICEICREFPVEHIHHRLRRSQGGTNDPENLMGLCAMCHEYIHDHPAHSYANGHLLRGLQ